MVTIRYKGKPGSREVPGAAEPQHPRDRIANQLKATPRRAKEIKKISPKADDAEHIARLLEAARRRGINALLKEIETHERKLALLREAVQQLLGETP
jgi:predicted  nucleic acid-binding Zn-ribbon protein